MNPLITVVLVILGVMGLAFPPLGLTLLALAFFNHRTYQSRVKQHLRGMQARQYEQEMRTRILAFKSLP